MNKAQKNESYRMMDYAYDEGVNFFDTAEIYPVYPKKETAGKTEEIIGDWLKSRKNRNKMIIASKIASGHPKGVGATGLKWIKRWI